MSPKNRPFCYRGLARPLYALHNVHVLIALLELLIATGAQVNF